MMLNEGLNRVRDLVDTYLDDGVFGTGTTAELVSDQTLETEVAATEGSTTSVTVTNLLKVTREIDSLTGNGSSLSEVAFQNNAGDTIVNRVTFSAFAKTDSVQMTAETRWHFS
jgi:hypothetical protein|tara:strand:- start:9331 stop:9669 length:339 start_codon:yes stop_codon:yes gene_type:complete